ncbi:MAG: gamma-butyrobetaine hydroxylase-like domain-containing protein, partial [Pseudomonadales bacterium]
MILARYILALITAISRGLQMQPPDAIETESNATRIARIDQHQRSLSIEWNDGKSASFHYLWLRDNCPSAFHPDTKERVFDQLSVTE